MRVILSRRTLSKKPTQVGFFTSAVYEDELMLSMARRKMSSLCNPVRVFCRSGVGALFIPASLLVFSDSIAWCCRQFETNNQLISNNIISFGLSRRCEATSSDLPSVWNEGCGT
jgi:hypothetical protein